MCVCLCVCERERKRLAGRGRYEEWAPVIMKAGKEEKLSGLIGRPETLRRADAESLPGSHIPI